MKKFLKVCLIVSGCLILFGGAFLGVTYAIKGPEIVKEVSRATNGHVSLGWDNDNWDDAGWRKEITGEFQINDDKAAKANEVTKLDIKFGAGVLNIVESNDDYFHINADTSYEYEYGVKNETFFLKCENDDVKLEGHRNYIQIAIPKNVKLEEVEIDLGACDCKIGSLVAKDKVDIELGAGSVEIASVDAKKFKTETGLGALTIDSLSVEDADLNVGMGSIEVKGLITGNLDLECGMGSAVVAVNDSEKNHNYDLSCGFGELVLGSRSYTNVSHEEKIDNHANSEYRISCSMGSVVVSFRENF